MVWSLGSTEEVVHLSSEWQRNTECISEEDRGTSQHSTSTVGRRLPPRVRQEDKGVRGAHDKRRTREVREELMGDASRERHDVQLRQDTISIVRRQDEPRLHGSPSAVRATNDLPSLVAQCNRNVESTSCRSSYFENNEKCETSKKKFTKCAWRARRFERIGNESRAVRRTDAKMFRVRGCWTCSSRMHTQDETQRTVGQTRKV